MEAQLESLQRTLRALPPHRDPELLTCRRPGALVSERPTPGVEAVPLGFIVAPDRSCECDAHGPLARQPGCATRAWYPRATASPLNVSSSEAGGTAAKTLATSADAISLTTCAHETALREAVWTDSGGTATGWTSG